MRLTANGGLETRVGQNLFRIGIIDDGLVVFLRLSGVFAARSLVRIGLLVRLRQPRAELFFDAKFVRTSSTLRLSVTCGLVWILRFL